jgi:hypothetical protein
MSYFSNETFRAKFLGLQTRFGKEAGLEDKLYMYEPAVSINHETRSDTANIQVFILDALSNFTASTQNFEVTCMLFPQIS